MKRTLKTCFLGLFLLVGLTALCDSAQAQTYYYKYVYTEMPDGAKIKNGSVTGFSYITFTQGKSGFYTSDANGFGSQYSRQYQRVSSDPIKFVFTNSHVGTECWNEGCDQVYGYHATGAVYFTSSYNYLLSALSNGGKDVFERQ